MSVKVSLLLLMVSLAGCATAPKGRPVQLDFLVDGNTTEEQVITKLGKPSATFEGNDILTYRLGFDARCCGYVVVDRDSEPISMWPPTAADRDNSWRPVADWDKARRSLVLVFDNEKVLRRHSIVEVVP